MNSTSFKIVFYLVLVTIAGCSQAELQPKKVADNVQLGQIQHVSMEQTNAVAVSDSKPDRAGNQIEYPSTGVDQWAPYARKSSNPARASWKEPAFALLDTGRALREYGRHDEAITVLNMIFAEPNPSNEWTDLSRHRACLELSEIYHERADPRSALRFAILARDQYPDSTGSFSCGLYAMSQQQMLEERIASLEKELDRVGVVQ